MELQISTGMVFAAWLVRMRFPFAGSSIAQDINFVSFMILYNSQE